MVLVLVVVVVVMNERVLPNKVFESANVICGSSLRLKLGLFAFANLPVELHLPNATCSCGFRQEGCYFCGEICSSHDGDDGRVRRSGCCNRAGFRYDILL